MTLTYRSTVGRRLTVVEGDGNIRHLANSEAVSVKNFGATGDGTTDDTAAIQAALDNLTSGSTLHFPAGQYKHDGSLLVPAVTDITIEFAGGAWLAPSAGWGLKATDADRLTLINPRVRLNSGSTATRGLWFVSSPWVDIYNPTIWSFINIPSNFVGIDVDDNSYWCEIRHAKIRKNTGALTGTFAKGVRYLNQSNAGKVWGGSFNHCDDGVYLDGSNVVGVIGASFEDCTDGVEMAEPSASGNNAGIIVMACRLENTTYLLNVSQTTDPTNGLGNNAGLPRLGLNTILSGTEITDPNGHGYQQLGDAVNLVDGNGNQIGLGSTAGLNRIDTAGSGANIFRLLNTSNSLTGLTLATLSATGATTIQSTTGIPAGGTAGVGYKFSSTSNFGVFFGSGAPSLAAAKGSLYLRSDGSGTSDRAYINTDGSTAWTSITTAG